jgi:signal transduction histidine kinase
MGYEALDAARSHRRTAEGVMRDYAGIAAWEFSRATRENLGSVLKDVFDDVPRRARWRRVPSPGVMVDGMRDAARSFDCACQGLRHRTTYFRIALPDGDGVLESEHGPPVRLEDLARSIRNRASAADRTRGAFLVDAGVLGADAALVGYQFWTDSLDVPEMAFGFVADLDAVRELVAGWYEQARLLPAAVVGSSPNDSLVRVIVRAPEGGVFFESRVAYPPDFTARDTVEAEGQVLVVEAAIRPDAAVRLVIGGLPRSRLPLLATMILLTLGVGVAALNQVRREYQLARLRDDFVSGVSHEFRTPLTQIRVFAELLEDGKLRTDEDWRRSVGVINREARRLSHLVENTLVFSSLRRAPPGPDTSEETSLAGALDEVLEAFAPLARSGGVTLSADLDGEPTVTCPRTALHQVLTNLMSNAIKYGPDGQTVVLGARSQGATVRVWVQDQGPGIPPPDRQRIWEPYRRLDRDVEGDERGSGIGLAVVAELCSRHGGRAWVEDGEGVGSRFVVELPAAATGRES